VEVKSNHLTRGEALNVNSLLSVSCLFLPFQRDLRRPLSDDWNTE